MNVAHAQTGNLTDTDRDTALALADTIYTQNLISDPNLAYTDVEFHKAMPEEKLSILRAIATDSINSRNNLDAEKVHELYLKEAKLQKSDRDINVTNIHALHIQLTSSSLEPDQTARLLGELQTYRNHSDWFVAHRAYILEAAYSGELLQLATALTQVQNARQIIPTTEGPFMKEALYETYDLIAYLYLLVNNPSLGIAATEQVVTQGAELNRNIDGIGHIGNLAYLFEKWRDYETAAKLTEIVIDLSKKNNLGINSIAYLRYGQSLNNLGQYAKAKPYLKNALKTENNTRLHLSLESQLAISFAGLGEIKNANASFVRFDQLAKKEGIDVSGFNKRRLHAQALIAVARGDAKATYDLVNTQLDQEMEQTFKRIGAAAQTQLAELENSKQRQEEREDAQKREIALKQNEIEAQQRSVMLLISLAVSLTLITLGAVAIAAWRQRTNKTLTAAAHIAKAGDRAKTQFLAVMTHELRTPLNPIIGISSVLCEYGETQTLRDQNKMIRDAGHNLLETLNGIIDMSQMESGTLKIVTAPADIRQLTEGLYRNYKAEIDTSAIQFTCYVANDIPNDLMLDSLRIKQGLSNLISNAIKFTQKGRIHIHVTLGEPEGGTDVRTLRMIVADTGQGVSESAQHKLFKPFIQADSSMTRDHGGAGVGLSVSRGLARLMGGDITMNSTAGRGSEFILTTKTCSAKDAEFDPATNRHTFTAQPSEKQTVDFSPAVSIEKLKSQQAEQAKKERKARKAERKLAKARHAASLQSEETETAQSPEQISEQVEEQTSEQQETHTGIKLPVEADDLMPEALRVEPLEPIELQASTTDAQATQDAHDIENQSTHAFEENETDLIELEQLLEPDTEQEIEPVNAPVDYTAQIDMPTASMPNPYAPTPVPSPTFESTPLVPVEALAAPAPLNTIQTSAENIPPRPTSKVADGAISHDQLEGLNILVVEDMLANQVVLRALLEPVGCQVTMADHGRKALDIMETQMFDVILMDIRMPVMDGIETTEHIRKNPGPHQNIPIIALTADASAETNAQCLAAGADVFLTKPVIVSELFSSIRFVREKQTRQKPNTALSA